MLCYSSSDTETIPLSTYDKLKEEILILNFWNVPSCKLGGGNPFILLEGEILLTFLFPFLLKSAHLLFLGNVAKDEDAHV